MTKTEQDFIDNLKNFYNLTGEIPRYKSYIKYPGMIYPGAEFAKKFGKFSIALELTGFEPFYDKNGLVNKKRLPEKETKHCLNCEKEIVSNYHKIFCNSSCYAIYKNRDKKYIKYYCEFCKKEFKRNFKNHIYCSIECRKNGQHLKSYIKFQKGEILTNKTLKENLVRLYGYRCFEESCGITDWNGKPITLEVDHIDGNPDNNFPNNLRLLCPNCHSQTPTFRNANPNKLKSDRRSRTRRKNYNKI